MEGSRKLISAIFAVILLAAPIFARSSANDTFGSQRSSLAKGTAAGERFKQVMTINNLLTWIDADGYSPQNSIQGGSADYPKGTGGIIYAEGMVWGAQVHDGDLPLIRVNGATYSTGLKAGKVLYDGSGNVTGSEDQTTRHAWRVRPDYTTADLASDAASSLKMGLDDVGQADIDEIYADYDYDWLNWPADEGAPYDDVDGDGSYDPAVDVPGWPGASQTIWLVTNDLPVIVGTDTTSYSAVSYGSPAIGMEEQLTIWAYGFSADHPLGNVVFKRARMIYTGLPWTPADAYMDSVFFVQWSDPDLGTYTDDYVGCDIETSFGFVYNGNSVDGTFQGDFGLPVPAGGYDFLQGPIVDGDTLGMSSFGYFGAGSSISDPDQGVYDGTLQWWNLMNGFLPTPITPQTPWSDPATGIVTKYALSGDPVTGIGWLDGIILPPGDRRLLLVTGAFTMALGDTQDVVVATVGGMGKDNISSVTVAKFHDTFAQYAYDNDFALPSPPATPVATGFGNDGSIGLSWGHDGAAVAATEEEVSLGFEFEGYNVYQLPTGEAAPSEGVLVATFDKVNLIQTIFDKGIDSETGFVLDQPKQFGTNTGVQRYFQTSQNEIRKQPITNDNPLYYAVTAYSYLTDNVGSPFKTLESTPSIVSIIPGLPNPGVSYEIPQGVLTTADHVGFSTGEVTALSIDPDAVISGDWEVFFSYFNLATGAPMAVVTAGDTLADGSPSYDWGWNAVRGTTSVLANQTAVYAYGDPVGDAPIVEGLQITVIDPAPDVADWDYQGDRWISGTDNGGGGLFGGALAGVNFFGSNITGDQYTAVELEFQDSTDVATNGYVAEGAVYWRHDGYGYSGIGELPFTAWEIDTDGARVRQLNVSFVENEDDGEGFPVANSIWDMGWFGAATDKEDLAFAALGGREYIFIHASTYNGGVDYDDDANWAPDADVIFAIWPAPRSRPYLLAEFTLQLYPALPADANDSYTFTTFARDESDDQAKTDVEMVNVFPNPYYGYHALEGRRQDKWVKFNHLPEKADIRIFNLGGTMVWVFEKDDATTQYVEWDLLSQGGFPVASGLYICHIDMGDLGTKILKLAIVQEEQILTRY